MDISDRLELVIADDCVQLLLTARRAAQWSHYRLSLRVRLFVSKCHFLLGASTPCAISFLLENPTMSQRHIAFHTAGKFG